MVTLKQRCPTVFWCSPHFKNIPKTTWYVHPCYCSSVKLVFWATSIKKINYFQQKSVKSIGNSDYGIFFFFKPTYFVVFRDKAICHIKMAIRHMWVVVNGLDNAILKARSDNLFQLFAAYDFNFWIRKFPMLVQHRGTFLPWLLKTTLVWPSWHLKHMHFLRA